MGALKRFLSYGRKFVLASNILFGCLSLGMAIAGFVMRFGDQPINAGILQKIKDSGPGISTDNFRPITESLKQAFGIFLILTGILSAPLVVFGFYTFLREKRNFLLAYAIVVGSLVVIQLFVNFHFARNPETVRELMKSYLRERINEYAGPYASDRVSLGWNYLMREYNCCGVDSVADLSVWNYYYYYYFYSYQICGGYSYYSNGNQEGCASVLFGAYYSNNSGAIWSMIVLGVLDQIFMFAFAITLFKKKKLKVGPARNSENEVSTTAAARAAAAAPQPLPQPPLPRLPPLTSTLAAVAAAGAAAPQPPPLSPPPPPALYMPSRAQTQQFFYPEIVPSISTSSAAQPPAPPQPVLPLPVPTNIFLGQPFQPGAVMLVPTSLNYGGNTMQNTYIPMTHMANHQYGNTAPYTNTVSHTENE